MTTILFDATRLLRRGGRRSPTGIDRVVLAYANWLLGRADVTLIPVWTWGDRVIRITDRRFQAVMRSALSACSDRQSLSPHPQWAQLVRALGAAGGTGQGLRPPPSRPGDGQRMRGRVDMGLRFVKSWGAMSLPAGAIYLNVGHSGLDQPALLDRLHRSQIRPVVLIHDLIPIVHPEYCGPGAAARHQRRMDTTLKYGAVILTNSETTAQEVRDYAQAQSVAAPPIFAAPLGLESSFTEPLNSPIAASPYFVCVGTIEPRKNLVMLLKIWRRLADKHGASTPQLVLIGRRGWENETVLDHLQRSPPVQRFVHEVADLRDDELATLIRGARALLAPSAAEGFDLPVIEALALSTPVVASDIPVHRELARGAVLVDPTDGPSWLREISALAVKPRRRLPAFAPPTWNDHFKIVEQALGLGGDPAGEASGQSSQPPARRLKVRKG